jgi:hypothetical protein
MSNFEDKIRSWVKIDDELRRKQEEAKVLRDKRNTIANSIHSYVHSNQMNNTVINISDGRLKFVETQSSQALTFKFLEECLNEIISNSATVEQILTHVKSRRNVKKTADIKRYYFDK